MNIGEFFIKLGVKGDDSAKKAMGGITNSLGEVRSMSLEAKAAILGVMYGLQRMMSNAGQVGTGLANFSALTGQSAEMLQRYQYAAMKVGVANGEVEASFKSIQKAMHDMAMGKGAPEGIGRLASLVGFDMDKAQNALYVMQKLQEYAKKETIDAERMRVLGSFGVGEGMQAGMVQNAFDPKILAQAEVYSNSQIKSLQRIDAMWASINRKIQMGFGKIFSTAEGERMIKDISKIVTEVMKLTEALIKLADKLKVFQALSDIMNFFSDSVNKMNEVVDVANSQPTTEKGKKEKTSKLLNYAGDFAKYMVENMTASRVTKDFQLDIAKGMKREPQSVGGTVNNTVNFNHQGTDAKETVDEFSKRMNETLRQMSAQSQGS